MNTYKIFKTLFVLPAVLLTAGAMCQSASAQTFFAAPAAAVPTPRMQQSPTSYVEGSYTRVHNFRPSRTTQLEQPRLAVQPAPRLTKRAPSSSRFSHVPVRLAVRSDIRTAVGDRKPTADTPAAPVFGSNRTLMDARLITGRVLR